MYLIKTVFKSPSGFDTREEEYADNDKWLTKKLIRIMDRYSHILGEEDREKLKEKGLSIKVFELTYK